MKNWLSNVGVDEALGVGEGDGEGVCACALNAVKIRTVNALILRE